MTWFCPIVRWLGNRSDSPLGKDSRRRRRGKRKKKKGILKESKVSFYNDKIKTLLDEEKEWRKGRRKRKEKR